MTTHDKATHPFEQIVGDVKAALKSLGPHGRLVLTVEKFDGCLVHRVERSQLTEDDWTRLMAEVPSGRKGTMVLRQKGAPTCCEHSGRDPRKVNP